MIIESITISGFRCFGPKPLTIPLSAEVAAVVGANAAGKTALLMALARLFSVSRTQRTLVRSDFHVPAGTVPEDTSSRDLFIEVLLGLPELVTGDATAETVAPTFRNMRLERAGDPPVCRMRLQARWEDDATLEGAVTQGLYWVDTLDAEPTEDDLHPVAAADRGLIQLYYTPASRDAAAQVRASTGALAARLLRAVEWSSGVRTEVLKATKALGDTFEGEAAIQAIGAALQARWSQLHDDVVDTRPRLSPVSRRFEEVITRIGVTFEQGPHGLERDLNALSDGQQSLFYFALVAAVFDLEREVVAGTVAGFQSDKLRIPALTLFALEEPENHLSPFFLARIVNEVRTLTAAGSSQALITSHSPAVLSRVHPTEVRYCRLDPTERTSSVMSIKLPTAAPEAAKFVRSALLAYPEVYFARFVLLVEGDSERIVLPKLAEALGLLVDPAFVAITPLGGRHVKHFWRLLNDLGIPHATLLDLDLGREGGGWGRVKTALKNLIDIGKPKPALLETTTGTLTDEALEGMHNWANDDDHSVLLSWVNSLKAYGVFFSKPLDLDLSMLHAFAETYAAITPAGGGPKMTEEKAADAILGTGGAGAGAYTGPYAGLPARFPAYRYHFLTHSKPASHIEAISRLGKVQLQAKMPPDLVEVLKYVSEKLQRD